MPSHDSWSLTVRWRCNITIIGKEEPGWMQKSTERGFGKTPQSGWEACCDKGGCGILCRCSTIIPPYHRSGSSLAGEHCHPDLLSFSPIDPNFPNIFNQIFSHVFFLLWMTRFEGCCDQVLWVWSVGRSCRSSNSILSTTRAVQCTNCTNQPLHCIREDFL